MKYIQYRNEGSILINLFIRNKFGIDIMVNEIVWYVMILLQGLGGVHRVTVLDIFRYTIFLEKRNEILLKFILTK